MSAEMIRHPKAMRRFLEYRTQERQSRTQLSSFLDNREGRSVSEGGEPASAFEKLHGRGTVEIASKRDIRLRREEQIERARRMWKIGNITPQWLRYLVDTAPETLLSGS